MYLDLQEVKNGKIFIDFEKTKGEKDYFEAKELLELLELIKHKLFEEK